MSSSFTHDANRLLNQIDLLINRLRKSLDQVVHRKADLFALTALALFFAAFFAKALVGKDYIVAGDALFYNYPMRTVAWRMIRSGELPLWTPYILSGYPLLSMAQLSLGYPLTWGYLIFSGLTAEKIYILAPFLLAPAFTYAFLRETGRSPLASMLGALTFGFGGMMASPIASSGLIPNAIMWLPLLLITIERSRRSNFISCLLGATVVYTMSVLTGHAQSFLTVGLLAAAYAAWLVLTTDDADQPRHFRARLSNFRQWRPLLVTAGAGLAAMGLTAFQILESSRVVRRSVRSTLSYRLFTQGSFKPRDLFRSFTTPIFNVIDMHAYVPPLAAALACVALFAHIRRMNGERDRRVYFWFAVAALACLLMIGEFTPFYRPLYYIPILNLFRVPSRHAAEWTFAVGILAAYGWDALAPLFRRRRATAKHDNVTTLYPALILILVGIVVGIFWWTKSQTLNQFAPGWPQSATIYKLWKGAFALLLMGALWRAGLIYNQRTRAIVLSVAILILCFVEPSLLLTRWWGALSTAAGRFTVPAATSRYLQQFPPAENRIYTRVDLMSEQLGAEPPKIDAPNLSAIWGLQNAAGYEPLLLDRYSQALGGAWLNGVNTIDLGPPDASLLLARSHVLDILNVTFVVSYDHLATSPSASAGASIAYADTWQRVYEDHGSQILRNTRVLPRAWLVTEAEAVHSETALARIRGESNTTFDPRRTALLEVQPNELPSLPGGISGPENSAQILTYEPNRIVIETSAPTTTVLVVSEIFYPGWEATIDAQPAKVYVADYLLRGLEMPRGRHIVEMRYRAPAARNGVIIALLTLCVLLTLAWWQRKQTSTANFDA